MPPKLTVPPLNIAAILLLLIPALVHGQQTPINRALIEACISGDDKQVADLLERGADPNTVRSGGITVLHWAAKGGHVKVMRLLIDKGANINVRADDGQSPLVEAATSREPQAVKILLDAGAKSDGTELTMACVVGRSDNVELLLNAGISPDFGIVSAAQNRHLELVQRLLKKGANVNAKARGDNTALHTGSLQGGLPVVQLLLKAGADPNVVNQTGQSPLHMAVSGDGDIERVKLLVQSGARLDIADKDGITPIRLAAIRGQKTIYGWLLEENGGKEPSPVPAGNLQAQQASKSNSQLIENLASSDYPTRSSAERQLVLRGKAVMPDVLKAIDSGTPLDRFYQLFAALGPDAEAAIPLLRSKLTDKDQVLGSIVTLRRINPDFIVALPEAEKRQAVEALVQSIVATQPNEASGYAAEAIATFGELAAPHFVKLLQNPNANIRRIAIGPLHRIRFSNAELRAELQKIANGDSDRVARLEAVDALGNQGASANGAKETLLAKLKNPPPHRPGETNQEKLDEERNWFEEAERAARSLGRFGPEVIDDLIPLLSPMESSSRVAAITALVSVGDPAIPRLITLLGHQDRAVATSAGVALNRMHGRAAPALATALASQNDQVVDHAANALWWIGGGAKTALPALNAVAGAEMRSDAVRIAAARAALKIDANQSRQSTDIRSTIPVLIRVLETGRFRDQGWAAEVARDLGPLARDALPALRKRLDLPPDGTDTDGLVRDYVVRQAGEAIKAIEAASAKP